MARNVRCESCGTALLGVETAGSGPVSEDKCPRCGGGELHRL